MPGGSGDTSTGAGLAGTGLAPNAGGSMGSRAVPMSGKDEAFAAKPLRPPLSGHVVWEAPQWKLRPFLVEAGTGRRKSRP